METKHYCHRCGSSLTEKFIDGRDRLFCTSCDKPVYENPIPATAAVVFNEHNEVLLVKRNVEPKAGEWCLPGGFLEMHEPPEQGCLRELTEETGLNGEIAGWAGNIISESPIYKSVLVTGYMIKNTTGKLQPGDDSEELAFFKTDPIPRIAFRSHRKILENALKMKTAHNPAYKELKQTHVDLTDPGCFGAYVITSGNHLDITEKACKAGAKILQYRDKQSSRKEMQKTAAAIREITAKYNTLFIVNDYIDIALMVGADGVHLGQDDIPINEARKITPQGFIIGVSTHSLEQAVEAEKQGADYIGSGPVFATPTKESYIPIGLDTVKQVMETVHIPVVAIGGLNRDNIAELRNIGVKNFAMVRAFQNDTETVIKNINPAARGPILHGHGV